MHPIKQIKFGILAAVKDTKDNLFHPVQNIKMVLGLANDDSWQKRIEDAKENALKVNQRAG